MTTDAIDLAGEWMVRADPEDRGIADGWMAVARWGCEGLTIELPAAMQKALGAEHRGVAWVARRVEIPEDWRGAGQRLWIRFESVATDATVWVNGRQVGRHFGDYIPFQFEITEAVGDGREVAIVVRVDQMHAPRQVPNEAGVITEHGHITKGFHDVLSIQHSGVWDAVRLWRTGAAAIAPHEIRVWSDPTTDRVDVQARFVGQTQNQHLRVTIHDSGGRLCGTSTEMLADGATTWRGFVTLTDRHVRTWSPSNPDLYTLSCELAGDGVVQKCGCRFAFRTITTGGPDTRQVLLNGKPLLIRGILHWGHEPDTIAPAPSHNQVRAEFAKLKEHGFNCVCLCMWYPPEHYFDIADEVGMLIWQEHPVWKSRMDEALIPEYKRLFEEFFRRDARHPSVIIVSGSCEHEKIHPELAAWWWKRAKELLPDKLVQVQTAFMAWTNPEQTDLHDEHVYDSSGRWAAFVEDVQAAIAEQPPKPFVMGETIIGTAWGDTGVTAGKGEWWYPKGVDECRGFEAKVRERYGAATLERFVQTAHRQNLAIRKFQSEALRCFNGCAGWVMNQIRDVSVGRLGFMDDVGRWRFTPEETRAWLGDRALLLRTPEQRRGLAAASPTAAEVGISNFGEKRMFGPVQVECQDSGPIALPIACATGEVKFGAFEIPPAVLKVPRRLTVRARTEGVPENSWHVWQFPEPGDVPRGTVRLEGLPYSAKEVEPDFEERAYSSGWGLTCRSWTPLLPDPGQAARAMAWRFNEPLPRDTRVVVTHQITRSLIEFAEAGGRVVLLANKTGPGLSAKFINVWGQTPLIPHESNGPLTEMDAEWIADLLHLDLFYRHPRAIAVEDLGIADQVDPIVRLVFTHDRGIPKMIDAAFRTRVGDGLLIASSFDHSGPAGQWALHRWLEYATSAAASASAQLDPVWLRGVARV